MNQYLIKYLLDNADNDLSRKYIDFFKIELDWHIYNGDSHISKPYHRDNKIAAKVRLIHLIQYSYALLNSTNIGEPGKANILSTIYFPEPQLINNLGYNLFSPVWSTVGWKNIFGNLETIKWHRKIQDLIRNGEFNSFLNLELHRNLERFQDKLLSEYRKQDFRALMLPTDQHFYSKYFIDIFRRMQRPSFIFSHGLPGVYIKDVDNRSDYLMVWGEKIKQNYITAGFAESKVKVVGHPKYRTLKKDQPLRSDLSDVLVIPISSAIYHKHGYDDTAMPDKSVAVLYLYEIQSVLKKLGIKKARYRVHPSINKAWIHPFLDTEFYIQDNESLNASLDRSSLVIGSTSTVLLESLIHGVNYILYEPTDESGMTMTNYKAVPPFDGSEDKLMVAADLLELEKMLSANAMTDYSLIHDYMQDFDLQVLKELIK